MKTKVGSWLQQNISAWTKKYGLFTLGLFVTPFSVVMLIVVIGTTGNPGDKRLIVLSLAVGIIGILALIQGITIINRED